MSVKTMDFHLNRQNGAVHKSIKVHPRYGTGPSWVEHPALAGGQWCIQRTNPRQTEHACHRDQEHGSVWRL